MTTRIDRSDAYRIRRVIGRWVGAGYVAYLVASTPEIVIDAAYVDAWWSPFAVVLTFVPGILLLLTSFAVDRDRPRVVTVLAGACVVGYLCAVLTWWLAWNGRPTSTERGTWLVLFPGLVSLAAILLPWRWFGLAHLVVVGTIVQITSAAGRPAAMGNWPPLGDLVWAVGFSGLFVLAGMMALRTGVLLDSSRVEVIEAVAVASARAAADAERSHFDALIHDHVLAVLVNVRAGVPDSSLASQAERAMLELSGVRDDGPNGGRPTDLVARLTGAVRLIDDSLGVSASVVDTPIDLPPNAVEALVDAAGEAVRNVIRHAGGRGKAEVEVTVMADRARVLVRDHGPGFDPHLVASNRMGLAVSIDRRMSAAGGIATVQSVVGLGTRVCLQWPR